MGTVRDRAPCWILQRDSKFEGNWCSLSPVQPFQAATRPSYVTHHTTPRHTAPRRWLATGRSLLQTPRARLSEFAVKGKNSLIKGKHLFVSQTDTYSHWHTGTISSQLFLCVGGGAGEWWCQSHWNWHHGLPPSLVTNYPEVQMARKGQEGQHTGNE